MFEHRNDPVLPRRRFARRLARSIVMGLGLICAGLGIGTLGYHFIENLPWIDAFYNASMILTGMGPVNPVQSTTGKLFASSYAIFSGVALPTTTGIILAPVVHRFLHKFHAEEYRRNHEPHPPARH